MKVEQCDKCKGKGELPILSSVLLFKPELERGDNSMTFIKCPKCNGGGLVMTNQSRPRSRFCRGCKWEFDFANCKNQYKKAFLKHDDGSSMVDYCMHYETKMNQSKGDEEE